MAKPAAHAQPTSAAVHVRPISTAGLVGSFPKFTLLRPSQIRPVYEGAAGGAAGGGTGGAAGGGTGGAGGGAAGGDDDKELGGRLKKLEKKLTKELTSSLTETFKSMIGDALKPLGEQLTAIAAGSGGGGGSGGKAGEGGAGGGGGTDDKNLENSPAFLGMKKKLEDIEKDNAKSKAELAAEKAKARNDARSRNLRESLSKQLAESGIPEDEVRRLSRATNELIREGIVKYDGDEDDAEIVFMDKDEGVDLPTGIAGWLKTDIGKSWLPPRGSAGSGDGAFGRNPGSKKQGQNLSDEDLVSHIFNRQ